MKIHRSLMIFWILLSSALGQAVAEQNVDAKALMVLTQACSTSLAMKTVYMETQTTRTFGPGGTNVEVLNCRTWFTRPNQMLFIRRNGDIAIAWYFNREKVAGYNAPPKNEYFQLNIRPDVSLYELVAKLNLFLPTLSRLLFSATPKEQVLSGIESLTFIGQQAVNGTPCYVLAAKSGRVDATFFFDGNGLLRRSTMIGRAGTDVAGVGEDTLYSFKSNGPIPDSTYTFTAPAGAKKVENKDF